MRAERLIYLCTSWLVGQMSRIGDPDVEDFLSKLLRGEYYVNPEAHNNPEQRDKLQTLEKALFHYDMAKITLPILTGQVLTLKEARLLEHNYAEPS
jgi:hypothetical protein